MLPVRNQPRRWRTAFALEVNCMHRMILLVTALSLVAICAALAVHGEAKSPADRIEAAQSSDAPAAASTSSNSATGFSATPGAESPSAPWNRPAGAPKERNRETKVWRSPVLDILAIGMGIGEVTGTAEKQIVLIDPNTVYVYGLNGQEMNRIAAYDASPLELKSVDVGKIRKQGPARIYVTAQNRSVVASFVLEYRNGTLVPVIKNVPYYLRVILYPTKGQMLLGQQRGMNKAYEGPIVRLDDKGEELKPTGRFGVPLKIPIFGFCIGDLEGKREPVIAVYDREEHLRLYLPTGKRVYLSKDYYGGSDVILRASGPEERSNNGMAADETEREYVRPRIMALDLEGKGKYEILTIMHQSKTMRLLGRFKMFEDGQVVALSWNGDTLEEKWKSPRIQGMVTDFTVDTLPVVPGQALITVERQKTDWLSFLSSKSQVRAYNLRDLMERRVRSDKEE